MVDATGVSIVEVVPALGGKLVKLEFTKANTTDVINVPAGLGATVVWCDVNLKSSLAKDPATAVTDLAVTLSAETGVMVGLFLLE